MTINNINPTIRAISAVTDIMKKKIIKFSIIKINNKIRLNLLYDGNRG